MGALTRRWMPTGRPIGTVDGMRVHRLRRFWERWRWVVTASNAGHLVWLAVATTGLTALVFAGALSQVRGFWTSWGWVGIVGGGILAWLVLSLSWLAYATAAYLFQK